MDSTSSLQSGEAAASYPLRIELDYQPKINYAFQQNDIPFLRAIRIINASEEKLADLIVRVKGEPGLAAEWQTRIAEIPAGKTYPVNKIPMSFSPQYLLDITERVAGLLRVVVRQPERVLLEQTFPFEVFAYNEWCGLSSLPEILAALVLPNNPGVEELLVQTRDGLKQNTGDASLSGYQSKDPRRIQAMAAALYEAAAQLDLSYINPPASFEETGQKVRFPDQILRNRMGTCMDLTLFFAACLEQCGLHPLVLLIKGHAFAGVWLVDEGFSDASLTDGVLVRKRVDIGQMLVFETTAVTQPRKPSFAEACAIGRSHLDGDENFLFAVDVHTARLRRIRPIAVPELKPPAQREPLVPESQPGAAHGERTAAPPPPPPVPTTEFCSSPVQPEEDRSGPDNELEIEMDTEAPDETQSPEAPPEDVPTRIARWKHKLLDFSLNNRLLNFRETKKNCRLLCPDLAKLEDSLAEGATFRLFSRNKIPFLNDPRDEQTHREQTGEDAVRAFLQDALRNRLLYADLPEKELESHLIEIYRESRVSLEEGGANTLYLALGFLAWYETKESEQKRLAPLILIPLQITRPSIQEGFRMCMLEEEARVNVTLLQMLEKDFGVRVEGLDPLPEDQRGIDIPKVLSVFKRAVLEIGRWEIEEIAYIGHFSFTKYLLWYDLDRQFDKMMENPVVKHLVQRAREAYNDGIPFPNPEQLDEDYPPEKVFCVTDADSSQLAAVLAAAQGKTFVLQGPPGTGKSQTITNIIAHCLAEGKRVLFVSAKMAALNVVYDRLRQLGLGPYCLELHSNKTNKKHVHNQLKEALNAPYSSSSGNWETVAKTLHNLRTNLNQYVKMLRTPQNFGETPFEVLAQLSKYHGKPFVNWEWSEGQSINPDVKGNVADAVECLVEAIKAVGDLSSHPFRACNVDQWHAHLEGQVSAAVRAMETTLHELAETLRQCAPLLLIREQGWTKQEIGLVIQLARLLTERAGATADLLGNPEWEGIKPKIQSWIQTGRQRDAHRRDLFQQFKENLFQLDLEQIHAWLLLAESSWFPKSWFYSFKAASLLKQAALPKQLPGKNDRRARVELALAVKRDESVLRQASVEARSWIGSLWNEGEADWNQVENALNWSERFRAVLSNIPGDDLEERQRIKERWIKLATEWADQLCPSSPLGQALRRLVELENHWEIQRNELAGLLKLDEEKAWGSDDDPEHLERAQATLAEWRDHLPDLHLWCGYIQARELVTRHGLAELAAGAEAGEFEAKQLPSVFEHSYYQWRLQRLLDEEPLLISFQSFEHSRKIQRFMRKDKEILRLAQAQTVNRLQQNIPNPGNVNEMSPIGILRRELKKKRRHKPVRLLLKEVENYVTRIKPCFLMSPLSVAQFIPMDFSPFDVVIFDEASQLPVWDAVGAIARGKQAIVVGDSKQLPPTNFFTKMDSEDEPVNEDELEDLESILDECEASCFPTYRLKWHYRSRHEHLIAFSNYHYYGNDLITFPSATDQVPDLGVKWCYFPDGVYDKGVSRTNRREAEAIADEIARRLRDPKLREQSIGVVTFNLAQQNLIEDLLDAKRREFPEIDPYFSRENEPVIVKNLENVQGDERDVIFLSITYGPDPQGRISMNFGPLNREGGERRLNVAITRARLQVQVYSSLRADQIDLSRTKAVGAYHLKTYLDYAERGPRAIAEAARFSGREDFESPLEEEVARALEKRGWTVHRQVGCSGYRVDLAVVHPGRPGRYLMGIECDGATYHRSTVARDRDRLREKVLRDLGWELHRVWSSDWWRNPEREIQQIEKALNAALDRSNRGEAETAAAEPAPAETPSPESPMAEPEWPETDPPGSLAPESQSENERVRIASAPAAPPMTETVEESKPAALPGARPYIPYDVIQPMGGSEEFYLPESNASIRQMIEEIVETEGPMAFDRLARLITNLWGMSKAGKKIRERVKKLIPAATLEIVCDRGIAFVWTKASLNQVYEGFRIPADGGYKRGMDEIPTVEIANAARAILRQQIQLPAEALMAEVARSFGFQRTTENMRSHIQAAVDELIQSNFCRPVNGDLILAD
ncbi:MAG: DUF3320 domain-containing protein [Candidatus Omnitrophica bacterium]|nr:DUF3320 domain-containing protein [Candidatus Omnitrophota bacterium]